MRPLWKRRRALTAGFAGALLALAFTLFASASSNADLCPAPGEDTGLYCSNNFALLSNRSSIAGYAASANYSVNSPDQPVAGLLVYQDYADLEARARQLLQDTLAFREDISPYQGKKNFDDLVRQFDQASDFTTSYYPPGQTAQTVQARIDQADRDLREARNLYAFLAVYAPRSVMRARTPYIELCAQSDNFVPPSQTDPTPGAVGPPIRDWCNFEARLSEAVREAANIRMIFGQQFMVAALGVGFSGTLYGGDQFVKEEIGKLRAAQDQFKKAEATLTEGFRIPIGSGCLVSDFYGQQEWSLLGRAADSQIEAQREIGVRLSYIGVSNPNDVPAAQAKSADELRDGYLQGYAKLVRMGGLASNNLQQCGQGVRLDAQLASDMAASMLEARRAALDLSSNRNVFGLDTNWTPTLSYASLAAAAEQRRKEAAEAETIAKNDMRYFDDKQVDLMNATNGLLTSLDMEVSNQLGCSRLFSASDAEFYGCARAQQKYLNECAEYAAYETVPPEHPIPGIDTFDQCMNRKNGEGKPLILTADGRQALYDLRGEMINMRSIQTKAANIRERIALSQGRNAIVTKWMLDRGVAQTVADVADQMYSTMVDSLNWSAGPMSQVAAVGAGALVTGAKAAAGAISTAADIEIENADLNKEVKNMLIDMSELLIDAEVARSAAQAKRVAFDGIIGHMDDVISQSQRQKAYLKILPGNDPAYRIIRDSSRLAAADAIRKAAVTAYLAARRAEYEYAARLSASGFRISDIYRARSSADVTSYMASLNGIILTNLSKASSDVYDLPPISVAQDALGWTDAALAKEGFTTPAAAEAERVRRFRGWLNQNTRVVNGEPQLNFSFGTTLLNGGLFANHYGNGYELFWLHKLAGVGVLTDGTGRRVRGMGVNLVTQQTGLTNAKVTVTQGGIEHLKNMDGCTFDFKLVEPAYMLGYEWATTQQPDVKSATFSADVNGANANVDTNFRTAQFEGRPVSATNWQVLLLSSVAGSTKKVDFQQLTDIQLLFSTLHASRAPGPAPKAGACARIDW